MDKTFTKLICNIIAARAEIAFDQVGEAERLRQIMFQKIVLAAHGPDPPPCNIRIPVRHITAVLL